MGLDMYLTRKFYVQNWDHMSDAEKHTITILKGGEPSAIPVDRICYIETEEIYWRKANAIHNWFVQNVQDGVDECQTSYVSRETLQELLDQVTLVLESSEVVDGPVANGATVEKVDGEVVAIPNIGRGKVLKDTAVAEEVLPTSRGFFFGNTDYDQWYVEHLKHTKDELERILSDNAGGEFYYHASW